MEVQGLPFLLVLITFLTGIFICLLYDSVYCIVNGAGYKRINGYYSARDGMYTKIGQYTSTITIPDLFTILSIKNNLQPKDGVIMFVKGNWLIASNDQGPKVIYHTDPAAVNITIHSPPNQYWMLSNDKDAPTPANVQCVGYLENSPSGGEAGSNVGSLLSRPVTTTLICVLCYYAYYLWKNHIDVAAVSYSYEAIIHRGEYWRIITASFAHFDLIHLGFNCMGLYQLGLLEPIYGSFAFAYLNIALVFFTMFICLLIHCLLIYRYNSSQYLTQQAVGYSCVLFAWMVALSVRLVKFCPIFIFPSLCMDTIFIPLPVSIAGVSSIPINFGPFLLLIFTQLILTRASFIGHLSGIVIGFPLAWNMLNFATPMNLIVLLTCSYLLIEKLYNNKYYNLYQLQVQSQGSLPPVSEVIDRSQSYTSYIRWCYCSVAILLAMLAEVFFNFTWWNWTILLVYLTLVYLFTTTILCKTIMYYTSYGYVGVECSKLMIVTFFFTIALLVYQFLNLIGLWMMESVLSTNGLSLTTIHIYTVFVSVLIVLELVNEYYLYQMMKEIVTTQQYLQPYRWDSATLNEDWLKVKQACNVYCCRSNTNSELELQNLEVFQQSEGNRLGYNPPPSAPPATTRSTEDRVRRERSLARFTNNIPSSTAAPSNSVSASVQNPLVEEATTTSQSSSSFGILSSFTQPVNVTTVNGLRYERVPLEDVQLLDGDGTSDNNTSRSVIRRNSPTSNENKQANKNSKILDV